MFFQLQSLKMTYHLLYGMNEFLPNMGVIDDYSWWDSFVSI